MTRRAAILGLLFVSQLATGCCWVRCGPGWRLHRRCAPACDGGPAVVGQSFSAPAPAPLLAGPGGPGCASCSTPAPVGPPDHYYGAAPLPIFPAPGPGPFAPGGPPAPMLGVPQPLGGPTVEPTTPRQ